MDISIRTFPIWNGTHQLHGMEQLLMDIAKCEICLPHLIDGVNPVLAAHKNSKVAIIGQAPGSIVHKTGIPWDDKSGDRLRDWLGVSKEKFYNPENFAIIPMGFCYPGKGKSGDLPPRKECAPTWHSQLFQFFDKIKLVLLIGSYAQEYYLKDQRKRTLTDTVKSYTHYLPNYLVLPHPSPRNNIWIKTNPWFESEVLPALKTKLIEIGIG